MCNILHGDTLPQMLNTVSLAQYLILTFLENGEKMRERILLIATGERKDKAQMIKSG